MQKYEIVDRWKLQRHPYHSEIRCRQERKDHHWSEENFQTRSSCLRWQEKNCREYWVDWESQFMSTNQGVITDKRSKRAAVLAAKFWHSFGKIDHYRASKGYSN